MNSPKCVLGIFLLCPFGIVSVMLFSSVTAFGGRFPANHPMSTPVPSVQCTSVPFEGASLLPTAGHLLYFPHPADDSAYTLTSTLEGFTGYSWSHPYAYLSPSGRWIAFSDYVDDRPIVHFREVEGEWQYSIVIPRSRAGVRLQWLNDRELFVAVTDTGTHPLQVHPYTIINPFTQETRLVAPWELTGPYGHSPSEPFLPVLYGEEFNISPDGRYALYQDRHSLYGNVAIYDLERGEPLRTLEVYLAPIPVLFWSPDSSAVAFSGPSRGDGVGWRLYIYDIESDSLDVVVDGQEPENASLSIELGSWSPTGTHLAARQSTSRTSLSSPDRLLLVEVSTGEVIDTCLTTHRDWHAQFAWSRDGSYLALFGVLDTAEPDSTGSVYILDLASNDIYEEYEGWASIVGWGSL